jgi:hypothetical protein
MRRGVEIEGFVWAEILRQEEGASLLIPFLGDFAILQFLIQVLQPGLEFWTFFRHLTRETVSSREKWIKHAGEDMMFKNTSSQLRSEVWGKEGEANPP